MAVSGSREENQRESRIGMAASASASTAREMPRWSTMLLLGFLLLLFGGLIGVLLAIALMLVRARPNDRRRYEDLPGLAEGSDPRETVALGRRSPTVVLVALGLDLVALLVARYAGGSIGFLLDGWGDGQIGGVASIVSSIDRTLMSGLPFLVLALLFMGIGGRYTRRMADRDANLLSTRAVVGAALVEVFWAWTTGAASYTAMLASWIVALVALPVATRGSRSLLAGLGLSEHTLVLVGESSSAGRVLGSLDTSTGQEILRVDAKATALPATLSDWLDSLGDDGVQNLQLVLCPKADEVGAALLLCREIESRGVACSLAVDFGADGRDGLEGEARIVDGVLIMQGALRRVRPLSVLLKRLFDILGAVAGLIVFLPVVVPIGLLVVRDGGPLLFAHERIGRRGRRFKCLKLRSMRPDAEAVLGELLDRDPQAREEWARDFKLRDDPRITRVGEFMRRTSLDELPQFLNVLKGDMSLVGPRPIVARELAQYYGHDAASYMSVKPGITGLWQISGRNDLSYEQRVELDRRYAVEWSIGGDIMIMLRSVEIVIQGRGAY